VISKIDGFEDVRYTGQALQIAETSVFALWIASLRDERARAKIIGRLRRASDGNFGDYKSVGGGVFELRVDHGPGYRVYYFRGAKELVVLLCGGDKRTQDSDVVEAKRLKEEIEKSGWTSTF
jgi:putative addiction module killer protein